MSINIQELFEDIIDTPAKRRKEVEAAGLRARDLFTQANTAGKLGFGGTLLSGQIASQIPQSTEAVRNSLIGMGAEGLKTDGERLADQLRRLDLTDGAQQREAIRLVQQVDPGRAAALEDAYVRREIERKEADANLANRYQVQSRTFDNGVMFNQTARGDMNMVIPATETSPARTIRDPEVIALEYAKAEAIEATTDQQREVARTRALAQATALETRANESINKANGIYNQVQLYDEALRLIEEEGATPDFISRWTPVVFQNPANIAFQNVANQLGLGVLGTVTFGALSAAELKVAMSTALPNFADKEATKQWLIDKKRLQTKLMDELVKYANWTRSTGIDIALPEMAEAYTKQRQADKEAMTPPAPGDIESGSEGTDPTQEAIAAQAAQIQASLNEDQ